MLPTGDATDIQLALIEELDTLLKQAEIPYWLFGGWAADFLVGEVTRPHEDIDLLIWREDAPAVRERLVSQGYVEAPPPPEEISLHTHFSKHGQPMDVMFISRGEPGDDEGIYWSNWRLPEGSTTESEGRLGELTCPVVSLTTLIESKEGYLRDSPDQSDREKYLLDVARLRRLLKDR